VPVENREAAAGGDEQVEQREQEEQRPEQGKEEELERCIDAFGPPQTPMIRYSGISEASKKT
jgi:hypothetical protein